MSRGLSPSLPDSPGGGSVLNMFLQNCENVCMSNSHSSCHGVPELSQIPGAQINGREESSRTQVVGRKEV
eukprot:9058689-Alexandrium_andersonii.AAC.1